jgi:hypothetical protein
MVARAERRSVNSRENATKKVLGIVSVNEIKEFLMDSVNLPDPIDYGEHKSHFERWLRRWQRLFTFRKEEEVETKVTLEDLLDGTAEAEENAKDVDRPKLLSIPISAEQLALFAPIVRTTLRRLWTEPDSRQRDWYFYRLRDAHRQMVRHLEGWQEDATWGGPRTVQRLMDYALQEVPTISAFEAAMYWLQLNHTLMLHCGNPMCDTPYFLRPEKTKRQKYCSPECADPARREAKLRWWNRSPNSPKNRGKV